MLMGFLLSRGFQDSTGAFKVQDKALGEHLQWGMAPGRIPLYELKTVKKLTLSKRSQAKSPTASPAKKEISTSETEHLGFYCLPLPLVKDISYRGLNKIENF